MIAVAGQLAQLAVHQWGGVYTCSTDAFNPPGKGTFQAEGRGEPVSKAWRGTVP